MPAHPNQTRSAEVYRFAKLMSTMTLHSEPLVNKRLLRGQRHAGPGRVESRHMVRLRLFFVWLLMAAIPMQGFAAASMLFCGGVTDHALVQTSAASQSLPDSHQAHAEVKHEHASHDHGMSGSHESVSPDTKHGAPETGHKCSICAACCNSVAIIGMDFAIAAAPAPQAELAEPFVLIAARATPVPDKPPRA